MIQIIGLREYTDKDGKLRTTDRVFDVGKVASVKWLFSNYEKVLSKIPKEEHYNLYYTMFPCTDEKRKMMFLNCVPVDVDGIDVERVNDYHQVILSAVGTDFNKTGIVFTGNGLQYYILTKIRYDHESVFKELRPLYKHLCKKVNIALNKAGLPGEMDSAVWSPSRILRLPGTKNIKKKKGEKKARMIQFIIEEQDVSLQTLVQMPQVRERDLVPVEEYAEYPPTDDEAVVKGCEFIKWAMENPAHVAYPEWFNLLGATAYFKDARKWSHKVSEGYGDYDRDQTDFKVDEWQNLGRPVRCDGIAHYKCDDCKYKGKITTPIQIQGEDYIATETTGFRKNILLRGKVKRGIVEFEDLRRKYHKDHPYVSVGGVIYTYNGKNWDLVESKETLKNYCHEKVTDPYSAARDRDEFMKLLQCTNVVSPKFFHKSVGYANFQNGVLNMNNGEFMPHSPDFGFRSVRSYDYDPKADCPKFKEFLGQVTQHDNDMKCTLVEFMAACLSNIHPNLLETCLILYGDGSNGKSVFLDVLKHLAGDKAYSCVSAGDLNKDTYRALIEGKLFNLSEETPRKGFLESDKFKKLVSGESLPVRHLYSQPYEVELHAKCIFSCNDLPYNNDTSAGMHRRLLIVPFDATFSAANGNRDINIREKLFKELPGIFNLVNQGYERLIHNLKKGKKFTVSPRSLHEQEEYSLDSNPVKSWFMDSVERYECESNLEDWFTRYKMEQEMRNNRVIDTMAAFSKRIRKIIGKQNVVRKNIEGKKVQMVIGYRIINIDDGRRMP
jgi:P4 family phage/plasmid primase-like protien